MRYNNYATCQFLSMEKRITTNKEQLNYIPRLQFMVAEFVLVFISSQIIGPGLTWERKGQALTLGNEGNIKIGK